MPDREVHELNCLINVSLLYLISELQLCHGLSKSDDSQESSWSDVHVGLLIKTISLDLPLLHVLCYNIVVKFSWNDWFFILGLSNESSHNLSLNYECVFSLWSLKSLVHSGNVSSQSLIVVFIDLIKKEEKQVKS